MKDKKVKQVLSRCRYQWEGRRHKESVKKGEYGGSLSTLVSVSFALQKFLI
jgi:hypothetical protein